MKLEKKNVFHGITLEDIQQSNINIRINEIILAIYDFYLNSLHKKVNETNKRKAAFDSYIDNIERILNEKFNTRVIDNINLGRYSANQLFVYPLINDIDIIGTIKKLERSILNNILKNEVFVNIDCVYLDYRKKLYTIETYLTTLTMVESDKYTFQYIAYYHDGFNPNSVIEYISIPNSFYIDFFLKNLCEGVAMKLITDLDYTVFDKVNEPLFNAKAFSNNIPDLIYKGLVKNGFLEKLSNTIFTVSKPNHSFTKLSWTATPNYSIQFFLEGLPLNIYNEYYIKKVKDEKKLDATRVSKLFININTDWFYEGRKKTIDELDKLEDKHQDIAKLKTIINEIRLIKLR